MPHSPPRFERADSVARRVRGHAGGDRIARARREAPRGRCTPRPLRFVSQPPRMAHVFAARFFFVNLGCLGARRRRAASPGCDSTSPRTRVARPDVRVRRGRNPGGEGRPSPPGFRPRRTRTSGRATRVRGEVESHPGEAARRLRAPRHPRLTKKKRAAKTCAILGGWDTKRSGRGVQRPRGASRRARAMRSPPAWPRTRRATESARSKRGGECGTDFRC